jgi:hypothetical protein
MWLGKIEDPQRRTTYRKKNKGGGRGGEREAYEFLTGRISLNAQAGASTDFVSNTESGPSLLATDFDDHPGCVAPRNKGPALNEDSHVDHHMITKDDGERMIC